jgi:hypothetical protein
VEEYMADLEQEVHPIKSVLTKCVQSNSSPDFLLKHNLMGPFCIVHLWTFDGNKLKKLPKGVQKNRKILVQAECVRQQSTLRWPLF